MIGRNNPLNVRYQRLNKWKVQIGQRKGFCEFSELEFGVRAAMYLVCRSYPQRGIMTYSEIINAYAPATENNTFAYVKFVCDNMGVFPFDTPYLNKQHVTIPLLIHIMSIYEGNKVSIEFCDRVYELYFKR